MYQAGFIYNTFKLNKKKERFAIILEPLQALLQLALLSFTPIDSKLNISNNILYIQTPNWNQSIMRSFNNDSKNDLFFLFNVFIRFNKFYSHLKNIKHDDTNLFVLLKHLCNKGIDNLLQTYKQTDNPALLHTLNIYKNMLNKIENDIPTESEEGTMIFDGDNLVKFNETIHNDSNSSTSVDIDAIFVNITKLYTEHDLIIIFHTLQLMLKHPNSYLEYMDGLNKILEPINKQIQKWIVDNIVY